MTPVRRRTRKAFANPASASALGPRRLLLDTQVWLWWQAGDARLGARARQVMTHAAEVRLSAASAWEIAIKVGIGKLTLPDDADIGAALSGSGFLALPVEIAHAEELRTLPALHGDPFDRLLVSQARVEGLTLVTADRQLATYGIAVLDATA